jgi:hypothetical protein
MKRDSMARKKKLREGEITGPIKDWTVSTEIQINGRNVTVGTEMKIKGERGRFRFMKHVTNADGVEWIDVWGGPKKSEHTRSFRLDRVQRVHYKNTTDQALAAEYKAKKIAIKAELEESNEDQD